MKELRISNGIVRRAQKVVLYGPEGIGKSTLASAFPDPLFIDTEGGTSHLNVKRVSIDGSFSDLIETIQTVAEQDVCRSLVLDTMDWAEQICVADLLKKYRQTSIESFGYGKGYTYLAEEVQQILRAFDSVIASGKNAVIVAHAKMRKQELPDEAGAFDRWELKLSRQAAPLVKEWADMLLFLNYKTMVIHTEDGSNKAQGGKRVIYTSHHPCWDAKNRCGLADELPLAFDSIARIFESLPELMAKSGITEEQIRSVVSEKVLPHDAPLSSCEDIIVRNWDRIASKVNKE
ncbi:MAG: ATP-binding protein [Succinivibrionaceae bacterium]|nr:ATP-binding protein [Succinivibrionaceae bacterium]MDY6337514.1 ATP-binding protein [Succinivibrionaceae bacterium]